MIITRHSKIKIGAREAHSPHTCFSQNTWSPIITIMHLQENYSFFHSNGYDYKNALVLLVCHLPTQWVFHWPNRNFPLPANAIDRVVNIVIYITINMYFTSHVLTSKTKIQTPFSLQWWLNKNEIYICFMKGVIAKLFLRKYIIWILNEENN